jgi:hypothetical protein
MDEDACSDTQDAFTDALEAPALVGCDLDHQSCGVDHAMGEPVQKED